MFGNYQISSFFKTFIKAYPETIAGVINNDDIEDKTEFSGKQIIFTKHNAVLKIIFDLMNI